MLCYSHWMCRVVSVINKVLVVMLVVLLLSLILCWYPKSTQWLWEACEWYFIAWVTSYHDLTNNRWWIRYHVQKTKSLCISKPNQTKNNWQQQHICYSWWHRGLQVPTQHLLRRFVTKEPTTFLNGGSNEAKCKYGFHVDQRINLLCTYKHLRTLKRHLTRGCLPLLTSETQWCLVHAEYHITVEIVLCLIICSK